VAPSAQDQGSCRARISITNVASAVSLNVPARATLGHPIELSGRLGLGGDASPSSREVTITRSVAGGEVQPVTLVVDTDHGSVGVEERDVQPSAVVQPTSSFTPLMTSHRPRPTSATKLTASPG
jgi:hypothetical protein